MLPDIITDIPGPKSRSLAGRLSAHESRNVTFVSEDFPVFWHKASGSNVWDVDGNCYLDFTSAFVVAVFSWALKCSRKTDSPPHESPPVSSFMRYNRA